ncbi:hypothetical protein BO86DRAFT_143993 [Aspergillus japonicus CBS 114.51]|uniref:Uncharacterized protein n=1 Tax=Aspergillus japonicus CBS 114.51 TaxID=1448312 RepID=A0A8T8WVU3_ASPJA|nr:hypothetical protein BO86DRAFT_143993 [Aspergillus japonicus CBS 114.51]RAH79943.1 hypothetical protein BO86DRAFT_143993 [Aspergillus japonicus CBS 114.51]
MQYMQYILCCVYVHCVPSPSAYPAVVPAIPAFHGRGGVIFRRRRQKKKKKKKEKDKKWLRRY